MREPECIRRLQAIGVSRDDAYALRRAAMTLSRWHERECGFDDGCIERDEQTGVPYWRNSYTMRRYRVPDRETGARKRIAATMRAYPELRAYIQGDPRGASLYVLRPDDAPVGQEDSHYSRGVAVYK